MDKYFKIVKDDAVSLRSKSKEVSEENIGEISTLVNKMHEYLCASQNKEIAEKYKLREGVGLAAPQIGKNVRAIVVYYNIEDENENVVEKVDHRLINPKIITESVRECYLAGGEGCLSVDKNHEGYVYRKYKIQVKAFDVIKQKDIIITARGYEAIVLQHEIDHLNGILYYDHIDKDDPFKVKPDTVRI